MSATPTVMRKTIGAEVRRGAYDITLDGERAGSVAMNDTLATSLEPGAHTLQLRSGRSSIKTRTFEFGEVGAANFRCTGRSALPVFRASFVVPSLALRLHRE